MNETNNGTVIEKGIITFGVPDNNGFKEVVNGKGWQGIGTPDPIISGNSSLVHVLEMTGTSHPVLYTIKILNLNHVQLTGGRILDNDDRIIGTQNSTDRYDKRWYSENIGANTLLFII